MKDAKPIDYSLLLLRLVAGITLLYYGSQKMLGVFGGEGLTATIAGFEKNLGVPPALAVCAIFSEFFGALGLIFGFLTRIAAFGVMATMSFASYQHLRDVDLFQPQTVQNYLYPILIGTMAASLLVSGPGKIAIDAAFGKKKS